MTAAILISAAIIFFTPPFFSRALQMALER